MRGDKELRPVGVRPSVRHAEDERLVVFHGEVLVLEHAAVDRLAAGAVRIGEVAALKEEALEAVIIRWSGKTMRVQRLNQPGGPAQPA